MALDKLIKKGVKMKKTILILVILIVGSISGFTEIEAQWRGPERNGVFPEKESLRFGHDILKKAFNSFCSAVEGLMFSYKVPLIRCSESVSERAKGEVACRCSVLSAAKKCLTRAVTARIPVGPISREGATVKSQ